MAATPLPQVIEALRRLRKPCWLAIGASALAVFLVTSSPTVRHQAPRLIQVCLVLALGSIVLWGVMELVLAGFLSVQAYRQGRAIGRARRAEREEEDPRGPKGR